MTIASPTDVGALIDSTQAIQRGHFVLSSGRHATTYVQGARLTEHPEHAMRLGAALAERISAHAIDVVVSPAIGALTIGFATAAALNVPFIFCERDNTGAMTLRRGFEIAPGARVAVVEDVITTGGSAGEVVRIVEGAGALPVAIACVVQRIDPPQPVNTLASQRPTVALHTLDVPSWSPEACPACTDELPIVRPGSRVQ